MQALSPELERLPPTPGGGLAEVLFLSEPGRRGVLRGGLLLACCFLSWNCYIFKS